MTELWGPALDAELAFRREQLVQARSGRYASCSNIHVSGTVGARRASEGFVTLIFEL